MRSFRFAAFVLPLAAVVTLVGCGSSTASPSTTSTPPAAGTPPPAGTPPAVPTPKPIATPVITGSVAGVINGHTIPLSTYRTFLSLAVHGSAGQPNVKIKTLAQQTKQEVIYDELVAEYAATHGITITNAQLDQREKQDEAQSGGPKAFQQRLKQFGLTLADYRTLVRPNLLAAKVEQKLFPVKTKLEPVAHVEHILIAPKPTGKPARTDAQARALANSILAQIQKGASFAVLARKYSDDPGSASRGGDLGKVYPGQMVPSFNKASFNLPVGKPAVIHSRFGYHVIEVLSRGKAPGQPTQAQSQQEQTKFLAWLKAQQKKASIKWVAQVKG